MNRPLPHRLAGTSIAPPREAAGGFPCSPAASYPTIGDGNVTRDRMTGEACSPNLSTLPPLPICGSCNLNPYRCICNAPDGTEDMMPATDVVRIMGLLSPDSGWALAWAAAEKSAYGMVKP